MQMEIISDMTRQYKSVFDDMNQKINSLENRKMENDGQNRKLQEEEHSLKD